MMGIEEKRYLIWTFDRLTGEPKRQLIVISLPAGVGFGAAR
ncbi:MAG TPA: hypothetical protein VN611_14845 [Patescibacteria group bacterium]|nr:hypothetical protein [Patescibacteria group bacterium]